MAADGEHRRVPSRTNRAISGLIFAVLGLVWAGAAAKGAEAGIPPPRARSAYSVDVYGNATRSAALLGSPYSCGHLSTSSSGHSSRVVAKAALGAVSAQLEGTLAIPGVPPGSGTEASTPLQSGDIAISIHNVRRYSATLRIPTPFDHGARQAPEPLALTTLLPRSDDPLCIAEFGRSRVEIAVLVGLFADGTASTWVDAYGAGRHEVVSTPVQQDIGGPHGAMISQVNGEAALVTADNLFAYHFAPLVGSGEPVRVLTLSANRFLNVTRRYPQLISTDASIWWGAFREAQDRNEEGHGGGLGILAPWVADECLLGEQVRAWDVVENLQRAGKLSGGEYRGLWPSGATYVRDLRKFLAQHGYCAP